MPVHNAAAGAAASAVNEVRKTCRRPALKGVAGYWRPSHTASATGAIAHHHSINMLPGTPAFPRNQVEKGSKFATNTKAWLTKRVRLTAGRTDKILTR